MALKPIYTVNVIPPENLHWHSLLLYCNTDNFAIAMKWLVAPLVSLTFALQHIIWLYWLGRTVSKCVNFYDDGDDINFFLIDHLALLTLHFPGALFQERHRLWGRRVPAAKRRGGVGGGTGRAGRGQHAVAVQDWAEEADGGGTPRPGARCAGMLVSQSVHASFERRECNNHFLC